MTVGNTEIGNQEIGNVEIGAAEKEQALAARQVMMRARDNRQPPPRMKAVGIDAPVTFPDAMTEWVKATCIGAAIATGQEQFPLTSRLLLRFGGGMEEPRVVRVDTEDSYMGYLEQLSPEIADLRARVDALAARLAAHEANPNAHQAELDHLVVLGADIEAREASKNVDAWLAPGAEGKVRLWREGDRICASVKWPGLDGEVKVCTASEPIARAMAEISRAAAEANVNGGAVIGYLPSMGHVLGAATCLKEMSAGAAAILGRPEAQRSEPFLIRLEPRSSPAVCTLLALAWMCRNGDAQARDEWNGLADEVRAAGVVPVAQAMNEATELLRKRAA